MHCKFSASIFSILSPICNIFPFPASDVKLPHIASFYERRVGVTHHSVVPHSLILTELPKRVLPPCRLSRFPRHACPKDCNRPAKRRADRAASAICISQVPDENTMPGALYREERDGSGVRGQHLRSWSRPDGEEGECQGS